MRYVSLGLVALGALFFPFAAKRAVLGLSEGGGGDFTRAVTMAVIGLILVTAGVYLSKQDEASSMWRNRNRPGRVRLRG